MKMGDKNWKFHQRMPPNMLQPWLGLCVLLPYVCPLGAEVKPDTQASLRDTR